MDAKANFVHGIENVVMLVITIKFSLKKNDMCTYVYMFRMEVKFFLKNKKGMMLKFHSPKVLF